MADKLKLSQKSSEQLSFLSSRMNLKRNLICRLALSKSLSTRNPVPDTLLTDTEGYEFNKSTILGSDEILFKSLSAFIQNKSADGEYFNIIIRNHIEIGLEIINSEYQEINSPVTYLAMLIDNGTPPSE